MASPVITLGEQQRRATPPQGTPVAHDGPPPSDESPIPLTRRSSPALRAQGSPGDSPDPPPATFESKEPGPAAVGAPAKGRKATLIGVPEPAVAPPLPRREPAPALKLVESGSDSAPEIAIGAGTLDPEDADEIHRSHEVPLAPSSRSIATAAHRPRPPKSSNEMRLPSVIVDLASDVRELVRRLTAGEADAAERLVQIGEPAVSELVGAFPGPITSELRRGVGDGPPRASDCGPLLRVLARIGVRAVPFVAVRTADADPRVRAWATRLLGEMPNLEAARSVARRLADDDVEVRRAALAAGRMMQADPDARAALRDDLAEMAGSHTHSSEVRQGALEALADLRDPRAVPRLIRLLGDRDSSIVKSAHWALTTLARQDFARDAVRWTQWWEQSAKKHRIEWLIDALMHDDADVRRSAGDELKSLTKEYFGYYDDLPKKERARAQQRYQDWWETKGKGRFPQ
jgi:hypothetical protein